jgi:hypothetical protein
MLPQLENLGKVAAVLNQIRGERFVFAGASILPLFLDPDFKGSLRLTKDTDVVVPVLHYAEWSRLRDALVATGFRERADIRSPGQIVFWLDDLRVDFIPVRMLEFGLRDHWLSLGYDLAEQDHLETGQTFLRLPVTVWLAAKIQAFNDRGRRDVHMSKDLEDIATLLVGRSGIAEDVRAAPLEMRAHIVGQITSWKKEPQILDTLDGCLHSAAERQRMAQRLDAMAAS